MAKDFKKHFTKDLGKAITKGRKEVAKTVTLSLIEKGPWWTGTFGENWIVSKSPVQATKKRKPDFSGKKVPLRKQVGVSHFGDVNMKGCQTGNAEQSLESVNAVSTLNKVINVDTLDSRGGANITQPTNTTGLPITMYDNSPTNVYQI